MFLSHNLHSDGGQIKKWPEISFKSETYSSAFLSSLLRIFRLYPVIFMSLYKYCSIVSGFFKQGWLEEKRARSSGELPLEVFSFGLRHYEFLSRDDALKLTLSSRFWKCYHTTAKALNTCLYFVFAKWRAGNSNIFPTEVDDAGTTQAEICLHSPMQKKI